MTAIRNWLGVRRWAPFYSLYRQQRKRTAMALAVAEDLTLQLAAAKAHRDIARSQAQTCLDELIDSEARCRRMDEQLDFLGWHELESWDA